MRDAAVAELDSRRFLRRQDRPRAADCRLQPEPQGHPETDCALVEARRQDVLWARPQTQRRLGAARWFAVSHVRQVHAVGSRCDTKNQRKIDAEMMPKAPLGTCPRSQGKRVKLKYGRAPLPTSVEAFRLRSPTSSATARKRRVGVRRGCSSERLKHQLVVAAVGVRPAAHHRHHFAAAAFDRAVHDAFRTCWASAPAAQRLRLHLIHYPVYGDHPDLPRCVALEPLENAEPAVCHGSLGSSNDFGMQPLDVLGAVD